MAELEVAVEGIEEAMAALQGLAVVMDSGKTVSLMIQNSTDNALIYQSAYQTSGIIFEVPQNRINPNTSATLGFHRTTIGFCGAEGVVVYKINGRNQSLCIFYSNPLVGRNGFFLQIVHGAAEATAGLCATMAGPQWIIVDQIRWHTVGLNHVCATGFMTQGNDASMIVKLSIHQ